MRAAYRRDPSALQPADREVVAAFLERRAADGRRLTTDGRVLEGYGMAREGRRIAEWLGGVVRMTDHPNAFAHRAQMLVYESLP